MRITQNFLYNSFLDRINENRAEASDIQTRLTTGKKVTKASDDSIAFAESRAVRTKGFKEEQYQNNLRSGLAQARLAQDAMDNVIDQLISIKETAIQGGSDAQTASERQVLAQKVESLREVILNELNSDYNGVYLFGGTNSGEQPFFEDTTALGGIGDTSNNSRLSIQASDATNIQFSVTGTELRDVNGADLFESLDNLIEGLRNNEQATISASLDQVNESIDHVVALASEQGNSINRMEFLYQQYEKRMISSERRISELVDADYAETVALFRQYQTAYEAALAVHSETMQTSLLNFL
jgi:flagellar hook-associated protein 3 FlgL